MMHLYNEEYPVATCTAWTMSQLEQHIFSYKDPIYINENYMCPSTV